jgi:hypothetical protein
MTLRFKTLVHRGGSDQWAAVATDGTLWETASHRVHRRPEWHPLPTGDMATPIQSLASRGGEMLVAVDAKGQAWQQANDGSLATRGKYTWHRLDWPVAEPDPA